MSPSPKASIELGFGIFVVGVRYVRSRFRRVRRRVATGTIEWSTTTPAGLVQLSRADDEHRNGVPVHAGHQYRFAVSLNGSHSGHVTALLDHGTDSAVVVPGLNANRSDDLLPDVLTALISHLAPLNPWLRRVSIALHPDEIKLARSLRLNGFDCEGDVPGYVQDEPGTRRQFWTTMIDRASITATGTT